MTPAGAERRYPDAALSTVAAWQPALNRAAMDDLLALVAPDVEVGSPKGTTRGAEAVAEWFGRTAMTVQSRRVFVRGDSVVEEVIAT